MGAGTWRRDWVRDAGLAVFVLAVAEFELVRSPATFNRSEAMLAAVPIAGALALRRRVPLATVFAVLAANIAHRLAFGHPAPGLAEPPNSFALASAWLIGVYSVAAFAPTLWAVVGFVAAAATTIGFTAGCACGPTVNDFLAALLLSVAVPWLGGFARARHYATVEARRIVEEQKQEHQRAEAEALAIERGRIARELHDIVAHGLSVIVVQASTERRQLPPEAVETQSVLSSIEDAGRSALTELRRLLGVLRASGDAPLEPQPGLEDLTGVVEAVRQAGIAVSVTTEGVPSPLPPGIELSAYRVAQEALTNVVKHAAASRADLTLRYSPGHLDVEVVDDGTATATDLPGGYGLLGARERVTLLGGTFVSGRPDAGGFRVLARFPLQTIS
ncbi:MAG TPA: sensor histidine kinase [Acidimicrobiales bacterium]|nr:sensor histidine kinase [Acidimicrobiales bacterium]